MRFRIGAEWELARSGIQSGPSGREEIENPWGACNATHLPGKIPWSELCTDKTPVELSSAKIYEMAWADGAGRNRYLRRR